MAFKFKVVIASIIALAANSALAGLATNAAVYLSADPGSWVGGATGASVVTWVHGVDGIFGGASNYGSYDRGVNISYNDGNYWNFQFSAPTYDPVTNTNNGQPLHVGLYTGAQRFPFNSPTRPGIDISGNGRGNNVETGWFNVLDISYDLSGELKTFAVDFKQFDESSTTVGLYGSLRFNSALPISPVPEASTSAMMLLGLLFGGSVLQRRRKYAVSMAR